MTLSRFRSRFHLAPSLSPLYFSSERSPRHAAFLQVHMVNRPASRRVLRLGGGEGGIWTILASRSAICFIGDQTPPQEQWLSLVILFRTPCPQVAEEGSIADTTTSIALASNATDQAEVTLSSSLR